MNKVMFAQIMRALGKIQDSIKLSGYIQKEKTARPKYPDVFSLETLVVKMKVECKHNYYCGTCDTKKRNKCWSTANKIIMRRILIKGIPHYTRTVLAEMKIAHLWILCSHLEISPARKSRSELVEVLMKKQYQLIQQEKKVKGKEKKVETKIPTI